MNILLGVIIIIGLVIMLTFIYSAILLNKLLNKGLFEFIQELKYNREINIKNGYENRIDIDYVIQRLEDIK